MELNKEMKNKPRRKIPLRTCVGCRSTKPKSEFIRVVRAPSGEVGIDLSGKANGRGAYLCPDKDCLVKATKRQGLAKALEVSINECRLRQIETDFLHGVEEKKETTG